MAISTTSQSVVCSPPRRGRPIFLPPPPSLTPPHPPLWRQLRSRRNDRQLFGAGPQKLAVRCPPIAAAAASASPPSGFSVGKLADVSIFSASSGEPALFKDLLDKNDGISVVALLRHFGCPCSWELASALRDTKSTFDSAGVSLIAVGVGTPDKARILGERLSFPLDCLYADPDRKAYNVLGLYYGLDRTFFNPASVKVFSRVDAYREVFKKYTSSATPNDTSSVLQQGGMFVFKGNRLLYARKDEGTGDHAPLDDILNLCCSSQVV